ncbi:MAG: NgoFVII family restriction endonuclease [Eubacterium sp.]|nr:NgoFVII family restriction endonuclease [Eubacterium sp.]
MKILYSDIMPLKTNDGQLKAAEQFADCFAKSDTVHIAVGYASKASLEELDALAEKHGTRKIVVTLGMYYIEGMPEGMYHQAIALNKKWISEGIGEIRVVFNMKYHGKLYTFYKDSCPAGAIAGSNNLGFIRVDASNRRQYEIAAYTDDAGEVSELQDFINALNGDNCSMNISNAGKMPLVREINKALAGQEFVEKIPEDTVKIYKEHQTVTSFEIPLKVPENLQDKSMRGSNINVCYAKGRKRVWWETEIVVDKKIRDETGYPEYQKPFMAVTDDGWKFQVWICGDNNKNLYSKDDLKIMGRWIKGRLSAAGLVSPVNNVSEDTGGQGIITQEMLTAYGRNTITLTKTDLTTVLDSGEVLDVWLLSFLPESRKDNQE